MLVKYRNTLARLFTNLSLDAEQKSWIYERPGLKILRVYVQCSAINIINVINLEICSRTKRRILIIRCSGTSSHKSFVSSFPFIKCLKETQRLFSPTVFYSGRNESRLNLIQEEQGSSSLLLHAETISVFPASFPQELGKNESTYHFLKCPESRKPFISQCFLVALGAGAPVYDNCGNSFSR